MWKEIGSIFSRIGRSGDDCRVVVLMGQGKSFCAGIDLSDPSLLVTKSHNNHTSNDNDNDDDDDDLARWGIGFRPKIQEMQSCFTALEQCPVPVLAVIHGACVGAGLDLICCTDIRLSSPDALYSVREVRLGLAADIGTLQRLPKLCGSSSQIREWIYTGDDMTAKDALQVGLVSRLSDTLLTDALQLACRIASLSPVAIAVTKSSLMYSRDHSIADGLEHIAILNSLALMSKDVGLSHVPNDDSPSGFKGMAPYSKL
jgi:Delta3,5-Delta2,4-dienoyl-CoA isomerase